MLTQISLIFIVFLLLLSTVLIFVKPPQVKQENFHNFRLPTQTAANVPAQYHEKGQPFYVGNNVPEIDDKPIVSPNGKYEFRKQQFLYDGVWGENCVIDGQGYEKCDWKETNSNYPLNKEGLTYGANYFFQEPKRLKMGEQIVSPPDCPITAKMYENGPTYLENSLTNPPIYLNKPDQEDILGFPPQDNNLYWNHPGVVLGYL